MRSVSEPGLIGGGDDDSGQLYGKLYFRGKAGHFSELEFLAHIQFVRRAGV